MGLKALLVVQSRRGSVAFDGGSTVSLVTEQQRWGARWPTSSVGDAKRKRVEAAAAAKETDARVGGNAVWHNKDKSWQEFQLGQ